MKYILIVSFSILTFFAQAQENIVAVIDDLTVKWDKQAEELETYSGIKYYCTAEVYREKTIALLDKIHHYDTLLYQIVSEKYENSSDKEADATLKDILTVEIEYTTPNFKAFLKEECVKFEEIGEEYDISSSKYFKEIEKLEKELAKYVDAVTARIDLIDEHVHHLKLD
ncbi:MAG: hypothetical protein RLN88_11200 [Ekhidna sp.]|uniref:hypothetical protein n=1 Tax=Ekhidna sp. TaxID=2608089 RepID=UPI0032EDF231